MWLVARLARPLWAMELGLYALASLVLVRIMAAVVGRAGAEGSRQAALSGRQSCQSASRHQQSRRRPTKSGRKIARRLRQETTMTLKRIADRFKMGNWMHVNYLLNGIVAKSEMTTRKYYNTRNRSIHLRGARSTAATKRCSTADSRPKGPDRLS